jgi:hypothetical protein
MKLLMSAIVATSFANPTDAPLVDAEAGRRGTHQKNGCDANDLVAVRNKFPIPVPLVVTGPTCKRKRDSSLQNSNRVHLPFMGATIHQNAEPRWQPSAFCDSQPYVSDMPVTLLEIKTAFGPEDTAAMITAFEEALKRLNVADREAHMGISVAKKIVRLAKRGECNPTRLTEAVISSFRTNPIPM